MSSANIYTFDATLSGRSLIYSRKRTGPRTLPRGHVVRMSVYDTEVDGSNPGISMLYS